jgi:hypothetical protein
MTRSWIRWLLGILVGEYLPEHFLLNRVASGCRIAVFG